MKAFGDYVQTLKKLYLDVVECGTDERVRAAVDAALDGQAGLELRRLVPLADLRSSGVFFTGAGMAAKAAARLMTSLTTDSRILDPACGAGDLLVACTKRLPT